MITAPSHSSTPKRPATPEDPPCVCGMAAVLVFETALFGLMAWCGARHDGPAS